MKFLIVSLVFISSAFAMDYDPKFHIKHRYNNHADAVENTSAVPRAQKMEASETSKGPLKTTPNSRKIFKEEKPEE